jgi:hypothetical protein
MAIDRQGVNMDLGDESLLTRERSDIWNRAVSLAQASTGMLYLPKRPGSDGQIWACGARPEGDSLVLVPHVFVPIGAMEWLLHEVGHWISSTPEERAMPDYGFGCGTPECREIEAWAFQEMVLAPFSGGSSARNLTPPAHRGGSPYDLGGDIPDSAVSHVRRQLRSLPGIDVEQWRATYGEWFAWGLSLGHRAPWLSEN